MNDEEQVSYSPLIRISIIMGGAVLDWETPKEGNFLLLCRLCSIIYLTFK